MATGQSLQGECSCGRNHYVVVLPENASSIAKVFFDSSSDSRESSFPPLCTSKTEQAMPQGRAHSSPFAAFLRVPLPWLQSTTYAFYPNEAHTDIRRVFTPWQAPQIKRHFCGFCGTPLTSWTEANSEEAEMISVNLASLRSDSFDILADTGVLPSATPNDESKGPGRFESMILQDRSTRSRGQPWFEEIIEGSELGRMTRRRGGETSSDGKTRVEWEIVEFNSDEGGDSGEGGIGTAKRKHDELAGGEDVTMK
ncbi:hypothetical protein MMC18_004724 [Xylographa bjoerkii]|nr:hypothetical protein [Xylographa bjoerkii]